MHHVVGLRPEQIAQRRIGPAVPQWVGGPVQRDVVDGEAVVGHGLGEWAGGADAGHIMAFVAQPMHERQQEMIEGEIDRAELAYFHDCALPAGTAAS